MATGQRVWLITGCSSGFGRALAEQVLRQGDALVATARDVASLEDLRQIDGIAADDLTIVGLDVTQRDTIDAAIQHAIDRFGRIDVLVNNAGAGLVGALEEYTEAEIEANLATNLWGPVRVTRAALPLFRRQRSGWIVAMSAVAGLVNEAGFSVYGASKFAVEGLFEALAQELRPLGIGVLLVEPGPFRTGFVGRSLVSASGRIEDYDATAGRLAKALKQLDGRQKGDPARAAVAICNALEEESPPFRLVLGTYAQKKLQGKLERLAEELASHGELGLDTDFAPAANRR